jgi:hypothetical protein
LGHTAQDLETIKLFHTISAASCIEFNEPVAAAKVWSAPSKELNSGFLLKLGANECELVLPEPLESPDKSPLPDSSIVSDRYEMTPHHLAKLLTAVVTILS